MFRLTSRVAVLQAVIAFAVAGITWFFWGEKAALSSAYGVAVALLTTLLTLWREWQCAANEAWTAQRHLGQMFRLGLERLILTGVLLALGFATEHAEPLALIGGFALGQLGWLAVLQKHKEQKTIN